MQISTTVNFQHKKQKAANILAAFLSKHFCYSGVNTMRLYRPLIVRCLNMYGSRRKPGPFGFSKTKFLYSTMLIYIIKKNILEVLIMKTKIKNFLAMVMLITCLCTLFSLNALAEEIEISKCSTMDPGDVCEKMVEIYGINTTVKYSMELTETCKYATSINVNGVQTVIYLSAKPTTGDNYIDKDNTEVDNEENSDINIITPSNKELMDFLRTKIVAVKDTQVNSQYIEINQYLSEYVSLQNAHYFLEEDLQDIKMLLTKKNVLDADAFITKNF